MLNFIIKTHQKGTIYKGRQIFILNKGLNSGKPQKEPFTNSFVIQFSNEEDAETVYWLTYNLWKAYFWHQSLCGSAIFFIQSGFQKSFMFKVNQMHLKQVQLLRLLELIEKLFHQNMDLYFVMKRVNLPRNHK